MVWYTKFAQLLSMVGVLYVFATGKKAERKGHFLNLHHCPARSAVEISFSLLYALKQHQNKCGLKLQ